MNDGQIVQLLVTNMRKIGKKKILGKMSHILVSWVVIAYRVAIAPCISGFLGVSGDQTIDLIVNDLQMAYNILRLNKISKGDLSQRKYEMPKPEDWIIPALKVRLEQLARAAGSSGDLEGSVTETGGES